MLCFMRLQSKSPNGWSIAQIASDLAMVDGEQHELGKANADCDVSLILQSSKTCSGMQSQGRG